MFNFQDKVVLVTGAGSGIGRSIAEAFARCGARVAVNDVTPINLDETVRRITAAGGKCKDYVHDVAMKMPVQAMIEEIRDDWERIDISINNAGVEPHASILDMDEWDWRRTIDVNLTGPFFTLQSVGRVMREQGGGAVVHIASIAGRAGGLRDRSAYVASKMGLIGLTREAAREFATYNIRETTEAQKHRTNLKKRLRSLLLQPCPASVLLCFCRPSYANSNWSCEIDRSQ